MLYHVVGCLVGWMVDYFPVLKRITHR